MKITFGRNATDKFLENIKIQQAIILYLLFFVEIIFFGSFVFSIVFSTWEYALANLVFFIFGAFIGFLGYYLLTRD